MPNENFGHDYRMKLMQFLQNPDVVVRVSDRINDMTRRDFREIKKVLKVLQTRYGINVARNEVIIGPAILPNQQEAFYLVTDRIHGLSLDRKIYKPEEKEEAKQMLHTLYLGIAGYLWDVFLEGGEYIDDITFSNEQFVYGRRKNDTKDAIWFTDIGPQLMVVDPRSGDILSCLTKLFEMIKQSESYLGEQFTETKEAIFTLLGNMPQDDQDYWKVLATRRELGDKKGT